MKDPPTKASRRVDSCEAKVAPNPMMEQHAICQANPQNDGVLIRRVDVAVVIPFSKDEAQLIGPVGIFGQQDMTEAFYFDIARSGRSSI